MYTWWSRDVDIGSWASTIITNSLGSFGRSANTSPFGAARDAIDKTRSALRIGLDRSDMTETIVPKNWRALQISSCRC